MLKRAPWTWQVPLYFWVSGIAGCSALIATLADLFGSPSDRDIVVVGRRLATGAAAIGVPLLIDDLKRPERFHHMLRVVNWTSPLSLGSWALGLFGMTHGAIGVLPLPGGPKRAVSVLGLPAAMFLPAYTGAVLAATANPLWARGRAWLPALFFMSGLSSALAALSLLLPGRSKLRDLETLALAAELCCVAGLVRTLGDLGRPLVHRPWGVPFWVGAVGLGQVVPLLVHWRWASVLVLAGSWLLRWLVVQAGRDSADDPQAALSYHR